MKQNDFLNGLSDEAKLWSIIDMSRDASGKIDADKVTDYAISTGHYSSDEQAYLAGIISSDDN